MFVGEGSGSVTRFYEVTIEDLLSLWRSATFAPYPHFITQAKKFLTNPAEGSPAAQKDARAKTLVLVPNYAGGDIAVADQILDLGIADMYHAESGVCTPLAVVPALRLIIALDAAKNKRARIGYKPMSGNAPGRRQEKLLRGMVKIVQRELYRMTTKAYDFHEQHLLKEARRREILRNDPWTAAYIAWWEPGYEESWWSWALEKRIADATNGEPSATDRLVSRISAAELAATAYSDEQLLYEIAPYAN